MFAQNNIDVSPVSGIFLQEWLKVVFWKVLEDWKCAHLGKQLLESLGAAKNNNSSEEIWISVPPETLWFISYSQKCYLASLCVLGN